VKVDQMEQFTRTNENYKVLQN